MTDDGFRWWHDGHDAGLTAFERHGDHPSPPAESRREPRTLRPGSLTTTSWETRPGWRRRFGEVRPMIAGENHGGGGSLPVRIGVPVDVQHRGQAPRQRRVLVGGARRGAQLCRAASCLVRRVSRETSHRLAPTPRPQGAAIPVRHSRSAVPFAGPVRPGGASARWRVGRAAVGRGRERHASSADVPRETSSRVGHARPEAGRAAMMVPMDEVLIEGTDPRVREYLGDAYPRIARFAEMLAADGVARGLIGPREVPRMWACL